MLASRAVLPARPRGSRVSTRQFAAKAAAPRTYKFDVERPFKTHLITDTMPKQVETTADELIDHFRQMTRMRRLEIAADGLYKAKKIRGFCHLYNGQEAVCAGIESAISKKDHVITAYREHTYMLGRGATAKGIMAELTGRTTGVSKGKGGSMHMFIDRFYGGNGIVGAQVPLGTGIAFAQKYLKSGEVCVTLYGDGASNQGQVFEAFNMASLWKLPVIYVCENNQYAMGTSISRSSASTDFYTRGDYVPGLWVDGMDVLAVKAATQYAANWTRAGKGPILLEMHTYRYVGHSMSDPGVTYRTRDEVQLVRETRDPIQKTKTRILESGIATADDLAAIEAEAKAEIEEAVKFATDDAASPRPPLSEVPTDVYNHATYVRGVELPLSYNVNL